MPSTSLVREVYYTPEQMFALVADVERYPKFVPSWQAVRVRNRSDTRYHTDQVVRLGPVRHTFSTDTRLVPYEAIEVFSDDPPFRQLRLRWEFQRADDGGCVIHLTVDFDLRSRALQALGSLLSKDSMVRMVNAFEERASILYGPPPRASHD